MRKIIAVLLVTVLVLSFTGCNGNSVVATVNGENLTKDVYECFLKNAKVSYVLSNQIRNPEDFWVNGTIEDMNATSYIKQQALDEAISYMVIRQKAIETGYVFSEGNQAWVDSYIQSLKDQGAEEYQKFLSDNFFTEKILPGILTDMVYEGELPYHYMKVKEYFDTKAVRVKHILIKTVDDNNEPLPATEIAVAKLKAEQILAAVQNGANFEEYIESDGQDPGTASNPDGYIFGPNGGMVAPFLEASLNLAVDEISGLVETNFGYHIIKRYPLDDSFYNGAREALLGEIGYEDYTTMIDEAIQNAVVVKMKEYDKLQ